MSLSALKTSESDSLLKNLLSNRARFHDAQDRARDAGDLANELAAGKMIDANLQIVGKLIGDLTAHSTTTTNNVFITPSWFRIRSAIMAALRPPAYRSARQAIAKCLLEIEAQPTVEGEPVKSPQVVAIDTVATEVK